LRAEGDTNLPVEIAFSKNQIVIHAPDSEGALLSIYSDGREIPRSERLERRRTESHEGMGPPF